ncbi:hypothetical protein OG604_00455 [Streptomyces sp. NBC_01231]|nr:hypothetical protein OG604_00455 [Streptomyces sp. NBC_01231]
MIASEQLPRVSDRLIDNDPQRLLFDGQADSHEPWQHLFSSEGFAFQEGLTHQERIEPRLRTNRVSSPLDRWNGAAIPALALIEAHAHRRAAEELHAAAAKAASPQARLLLQELHVLFALRYIAAHSGGLLTHGRLTADQVLQLPDTAEDAVAAPVPSSGPSRPVRASPKSCQRELPGSDADRP